MKKLVFLLILLLTQLQLGQATEIISVRPLTDRILQLHFSDGYIQYHGIGQTAADDIVFNAPLDLVLATNLATYTLLSPTDNNYAGGRSPIDLGRKTKGKAFTAICQDWGYLPYFDDLGCINTDPDHVKEHFIYLFLPHPLVEGATYTLTTGNLAQASNTFSFNFSTASSRSDAVHVNQIGYSTAAPQKFGYVYAWIGDKGGVDLSTYAGNAFRLLDAQTLQPVFTGQLNFRKPATSQETGQFSDTPDGNFLGAATYECDFSAFNTPGDYVLSVRGIGCSYPFSIGADALRTPFQYVMRGIYQNRSGIDLTMPYAQARPAPHNVLSTPGFAGRLKYTTTSWCEVSAADADMADKPLWDAGIVGDLTDTWGWYQDAGDWDGYLTHMKLPTYLLFLFEQFPTHFSDGDILLPESGNGQPDVLDEARWLLRFYKRLRDELRQKGWGSGGVGGARIFGDLWGENSALDGTERPSWQDNTRTWVVSGEDAYVSFWYAAAAAHYHYLTTENGWTDAEGINWLAEAEDVYAWARNRADTPNTCHDFSLAPIRAYAAVSLYKASGIVTYHEHFLQDVPSLSYASTNASLTDVGAYAAWQYASLPASRPTDAQVVANVFASIASTADFQLLFPALDNRACRWGGDFWFPMLIGQGTTPFVAEGVMAYALLRQNNPAQALAYKTVLHNTADYFLGNNPLNTTWVTGLGENPPQDIFHIDSWLSPSGGVRLGIVPYGPWRRQYFGPYGWWRAEWAALTTYPDYDLFPGHERWFTQRTVPLTAEFTIHQNNLMSAFLFGALLDTNRLVNALEPISSLPESIGLKVFPNPTTGHLLIELTSGEPSYYRVFNTIGQQQLAGQWLANQPIDLSHLPPGVYWIQVSDQARKLQTAKFIKE